MIYSTSWILIIPVTVFAAALFWIPGLVPAWICGARKDKLSVLSPAFTVVIITFSAVIAPLFDLKWSLLPLLIGISLASIFAFLVFLIFRRWIKFDWVLDAQLRNSQCSSGHNWLFFSLLAAAFTAASLRLFFTIGGVDAFSQTWDNAFHINAIQAIIETGNASTFNMDVYDLNDQMYYPAAWHDFVSLVALTLNVSPALATNACTIVIAFLYWPIAIYYLAFVIFKNSKVALCAIPLSVMFPQFPWGFIWYGALYPNLLSYIFLPAAIAMTYLGMKYRSAITYWYVAVVLVICAAMGLSQPNAIFLFAIGFFAILSAFIFRSVKLYLKLGKFSGVFAAFIAVSIVLICGLILNYLIDQIPTTAGMRRGYEYWKPQGGIIEAVIQLVTFTGGSSEAPTIYFWPNTLFLAILVLVGIIYLLCQQRGLWTLTLYGFWSVMFLVCFAFPSGNLRVYLLGLWYCDLPRLTAQLIVLAPIFSAYGSYQLSIWIAQNWFFIRRQVMNLSQNMVRRNWIISIFSFAVVLISPAINDALGQTRYYFERSEKSLVSQDESDLFNWMAQNLDGDELVLGNPWEGASFSWGMGGPQVFFPKITSELEDGEHSFIATNLRNLNQRNEVCAIIKDESIGYVLDLEDKYLWDGSGYDIELRYPGFDNLDDSDVGTLVKQFGNAKLFKIKMCDQ